MADDRYIHHGTCDACATGPVPLRETESDAWICQECSDRIDHGIEVAAAVTGLTHDQVAVVIAAYEATFYEEAELEDRIEPPPNIIEAEEVARIKRILPSAALPAAWHKWIGELIATVEYLNALRKQDLDRLNAPPEKPLPKTERIPWYQAAGRMWRNSGGKLLRVDHVEHNGVEPTLHGGIVPEAWFYPVIDPGGMVEVLVQDG